MKQLLIPRKKLLISLIIFFLSTAFLAVVSMQLQRGDALQIRIDSQNVLFWGIVVLLVQILTALFLYGGHNTLAGNLNRLKRIGDLNHPHAKKILRDMGELGKGIEDMVLEQNQLISLKSGRITALNSLTKMLCSGYSELLAISDVKGDIFGISQVLTDSIRKEMPDNPLNHIYDLRSDLPLGEILNHLEAFKLPWSDAEYPGITCTPLFDSENKIHFCLWELETEKFRKNFKERLKETPVKKDLSRVRGFLGDLVKRRTSGKG